MFQSKLPATGLTIFSQMSQLAQQHGALNLSQGFPDFPAPSALLDLLADYTKQGFNQYAPMQGIPALREQLVQDFARRYSYVPCPESEITITPGATQALFCAIQTLVRQGDEVIVFDPCYDSYEPAVQLAGGVCVHVPLTEHFAYDWQAFTEALSPKTRLVIINSPHNPGTALLTAEDMRQLSQLTERKGIYILSDEVYEHLLYDGRKHESVLNYPELYQRACVVGSFGKTFHVTGWKTGYLAAPAWLTAEVRKVHQFVSFCSPTPLQMALAEFMARHPEHIQGLAPFYQAKRDQLCDALSNSRFSFQPSAGTYFQLVDYRAIRDDLNDVEMARWLTQHKGIASIPLSVFYERPPENQYLLRLCFAKTAATLEQAGEVLCAI